MALKSALITGVTGQDGAYLADLLLKRGYRVAGTTRDLRRADLTNLQRLGIAGNIRLVAMDGIDRLSVAAAIAHVEPDEIYAFAGQSSVGRSFEQPAITVESIVLGTLNLLETARMSRREMRLCHASSGECFGDLDGSRAREGDPFRPASPYAVAKASAHMLVENYRKSYGLFAVNAILFNHESPLRSERFVTRKIIAAAARIAAARIAAASDERLMLGRLDIARDWGWAPEYVDGMWRMLQAPQPSDFILATGQTNSLRDFVAAAFSEFGLEWNDHVDTDPSLIRPEDPGWSGGNPARAASLLGWRAQCRMAEVVRLLCEHQRSSAPGAP